MILLTVPTQMVPVSDSTAHQALPVWPSEGLDVGLDLKGVVQALNSVVKGGKNVDVSGISDACTLSLKKLEPFALEVRCDSWRHGDVS